MRSLTIAMLFSLTSAVYADCSFLDLRCKADESDRQEEALQKQKQAEIDYPKHLEYAYALRTKNIEPMYRGGAILYEATNAAAACKQVGFDMTSEIGKRCVVDIDRKVEEFKAQIRAQTVRIKTCREWAIFLGARWENASSGMKVNPLGLNENPIQFAGMIDDGNAESLTIRDDANNAILKITKDTAIVDKDSIAIGSKVRGYGIQSSKAEVTLVSGRKTTIPVIEAWCIE